jgi:hypothetical protein
VCRAGRRWLVHRWVHHIVYGPIPDEHDVHHRCAFTLCINPAHIPETLHHDEHASLEREIAEWVAAGCAA